MKNLILIFSVLIFFASCSSSDDSGDVIDIKFEQIKTVLPQGEWKVTSFYKDNTNRTQDFESFVFTFDEDGTVIGQTDLYTEVGTWNYLNFPDTGEELDLDFSGTPPFDEISITWHIVSVSNSKVELAIQSDSNVNTQLLTFSKI